MSQQYLYKVNTYYYFRSWIPLDLQHLYQGDGGDEGDRTPYLNAASVALYQMSYVPMCSNFTVQ